MTRPQRLARCLAIWFALLAASACLAPYFDHGPPASWPGWARTATPYFLAPGGLIWTILFWHPFGGGPNGVGRVFIAFMNSSLWLIAGCAAARVFRSLHARLKT